MKTILFLGLLLVHVSDAKFTIEFNLLIFTRESTESKFQLLALQGSPWEKINLIQRSILRFHEQVDESPPAYV